MPTPDRKHLSERYRDEGYMVIRDLLPPEHVAALRRRIGEIAGGHGDLPVRTSSSNPADRPFASPIVARKTIAFSGSTPVTMPSWTWSKP